MIAPTCVRIASDGRRTADERCPLDIQHTRRCLTSYELIHASGLEGASQAHAPMSAARNQAKGHFSIPRSDTGSWSFDPTRAIHFYHTSRTWMTGVPRETEHASVGQPSWS
jgi:hypothetical protein